MCYRTKLNAKLQDIEKTFDARFIDPQDYSPREEINAFDFRKTPVIIDENQGEIEMFHWGLIPFWAKDPDIRKMTLNAKIETITEKPAFRDVVNNRCLVIADGYYEWQWQDQKGTQKQKYLIQSRSQSIFAFAGIYSSWRDPKSDELFLTYSILTTTANELMSKIHNHKKRMPVLLQDQDHQKWLKGKKFTEFAFPYDVELTAVPLSTSGDQQQLNF